MKSTVMHLISSAGFFGAERVVVELARGMATSGHQVTVAVMTSRPALIEEFHGHLGGIELIVFDGAAGRLPAVARAIRERCVTILHSHGYKSDIFAWLAVKLIPPAARPILFATNHSWLTGTGRENLYKYIDILALRRFQAIAAVSAKVQRLMFKAGIASGKIHCVDNGIDVDDPAFATSKATARAKLDIDADTFAIACIARFSPEKAHGDLLKAFAMAMPDLPQPAQLVLIGEGGEEANLRQLAASLNLASAVRLIAPRADIRSLYSAFDCFALASYDEGMPMVIFEAMAAGTPVVASQVGGLGDMLADGGCGLLFQAGQVGELAAGLRLLAHDRQTARALAAAARQRVREHYSTARMTERYLELYEMETGR